MLLLWKTFFKSSDENNVVNTNDFAKLSDSIHGIPIYPPYHLMK